jgi:hypothetical protein
MGQERQRRHGTGRGRSTGYTGVTTGIPSAADLPSKRGGAGAAGVLRVRLHSGHMDAKIAR